MTAKTQGLVQIQILDSNAQWQTVQTLSGSQSTAKVALKLAVDRALRFRPNCHLGRAIDAKTGAMLYRLEKKKRH